MVSAAPVVHSVEVWRAAPPFNIDTVWVVIGGGLLLIINIGLLENSNKAGLASPVIRVGVSISRYLRAYIQNSV